MQENNIIEDDTDKEYVLSEEMEPFKKGSSTKSFFANRIANRVVLLILSVLILGLAFCPIVYTEAELDNGIDARIEYSAFDSLRVAYSSFQFMTVKGAQATRAGVRLDGQYDFLAGSYQGGEFSFKEKMLLKSIAENELLVTLKFISSPVRISYIVAAVTGALYIIVAAVMFFAAARSLIGAVANRHHVSDGRDKHFDRAVGMLWLVALLLPVLSYTFMQMCNFASTGTLAAFNKGGKGLAFGFFITVAVALLGSVLYLVKYLREAKRSNKGRFSDKAKVDFKSCILSLIIIICTFLPMFSINLVRYTASTYREETVYLDVYDISELSGADVKKYSSVSRVESMKRLEEYRDDAINGRITDTDIFAVEVYNTLVIGYGRFDISILNIAVMGVIVLLVLISVFLIRATLNSLFLGIESTKKIKRLKILLFIAALAYLGLGTALYVIGNSCVTETLENYLDISMGPGLVIVAALSIWVVTTLRSRKVSFIDAEYDNADTSYAPYVVKTDSI